MRALAPLLVLALAGCASHTGVRAGPDFTAAMLVPLPPHLAPPTVMPEAPVKVRGVNAIAQAARNTLIQPTDREMDGIVWRIANADPTKVYAIPVAPLAPTTILFPVGETLTGDVSGSTQDFAVGAAVTGNRAAITVMPNCASPNTERYGPESDLPLVRCMIGRAKTTFLTDAQPYNFEFHVYDVTSTRTVEINHAPPPLTNVHGTQGQPPFPRGPADALSIAAIGEWKPAWQPTQAYADAEKMVIRFPAPLPALPGLYVGMNGEAAVNYSVVEADNGVYLVTHRRVTEAQLRLDEQVVQISSGTPEELQAPTNDRWETGR